MRGAFTLIELSSLARDNSLGVAQVVEVVDIEGKLGRAARNSPAVAAREIGQLLLDLGDAQAAGEEPGDGRQADRHRHRDLGLARIEEALDKRSVAQNRLGADKKLAARGHLTFFKPDENIPSIRKPGKIIFLR